MCFLFSLDYCRVLEYFTRKFELYSQCFRCNYTLKKFIQVFEDDCSVISDNPPIVTPEPSDNEQRRPDNKPVLSRAPSVDEIDNIDLDSEEKEKDVKVNGETDTSDTREIDSLKDLDDEDDDVHLKSVVENPDMRRESIAEIKRLAEGIVQKSDGRGLLCSVDSANVNLNGVDQRSSVEENGPSPQQHTSVIVTNPSVDLVPSGSPASGGTTGKCYFRISYKISAYYVFHPFCLDVKNHIYYISIDIDIEVHQI